MSKRKAQRLRPIGRRTGRRLANGLEVEVFEGPPVGPGVVTADLDSLLAAIERFDPDMPWKKARHDILPMLPRVRPFPGPPLDLVRVMLPPGILVGFGIDIGPAITFVGEPLLERWKVDVPTVTASALDNLRLLAEMLDPDLVHHDRIGDVPVSVIQTHLGIAASLVLVADRLEPLIGCGERLLLAPMRDILIALPPDVDRSFAEWLAEEWESLDPNHLHLGGFRYADGAVVPEALDEAIAQA